MSKTDKKGGFPLEKARSILALVLLMAAAFLIGLALSQCGRSPNIPLQTDPPQTSAPTESSAPEATKAATAPEETTAPPETDPATNPPEPTKSPNGTDATPPPETTAPPETAPPPDPTAPVETAPDPYGISSHPGSGLEYSIWEEVNRFREDNALPPLTLDPQLCALASLRAYELNQLRGHLRPDGRACESILSDNGYPFRSAADNLFCSSPDTTAEDILSTWLANPENQTVLLDPAYTVFGAGIFESDGIINVAAFFTEAP